MPAKATSKHAAAAAATTSKEELTKRYRLVHMRRLCYRAGVESATKQVVSEDAPALMRRATVVLFAAAVAHAANRGRKTVYPGDVDDAAAGLGLSAISAVPYDTI